MNMSAAMITKGSARGLDVIVERGRAPEQVLTGFRFVEGPAWHPGNQVLIFSDIIGDTLYRWSPGSKPQIIRRPSHMANGNTWDLEGRLLSCEHATSRVSRSNADGSYEILASHYEGRVLNSPNDIVVKRDGAVYFTDPNSGRSEKYGVARPQELPFQGVYRLDADAGALALLVDDFLKPNGLCFSRDESLMYINDTDRQHIRVFDVLSDGTLGNDRVWAETSGKEPGVADGMKVDSEGNLYCCGSGGIHVFDPEGHRIGVVATPEVAANFAWGGDGLTDLYVTATHSVYRLRTKVPGHEPFVPGPNHV